MDCSMPGFPVPHCLLELAQTHVHWVSNTIQPFHPLSIHFFLPSIFPSIRIFCNQSVLHMGWPKYWIFSFSISPSKEYSGLIFLWDRLVWSPCNPRNSQESSTTLKSIHLVLRLLYGTTLISIHDWKTIALNIWTFVSKIMSLLFNMLFRFVIASLPRSKCHLISWMQSPCIVIFGALKNKIPHCSYCFPSNFHERMDWMPWPLCFECWVLSQLFHSPLPPSSRGSIVPLHFMP